MNVISSLRNGLVHSDNAAAYMWGGTLAASGQTFSVSQDGSERIDSYGAICLCVKPRIKGDVQIVYCKLVFGNYRRELGVSRRETEQKWTERAERVD